MLFKLTLRWGWDTGIVRRGMGVPGCILGRTATERAEGDLERTKKESQEMC